MEGVLSLELITRAQEARAQRLLVEQAIASLSLLDNRPIDTSQTPPHPKPMTPLSKATPLTEATIEAPIFTLEAFAPTTTLEPDYRTDIPTKRPPKKSPPNDVVATEESAILQEQKANNTEACIQKCLAQGDREEVVRLCLPIIKYVVSKALLPTQDDRETAIVDSMTAVWRLTERYDPERGRFLTFAWKRISGAIIDSYRTTYHIKRRREGEARIGEITLRPSTAPLDAPLFSHTQLKIADTIRDQSAGPEELIVDNDLRERRLALYHEAIKSIGDRDKAILAMRMGGMNLQAIGDHYGVSESRICQVMNRLERQLSKTIRRLISEQGGELDEFWSHDT